MADQHVPVCLPRIVQILSPALTSPGSIYVDCTTGLGGHAGAILRANPNARLIALDRDADAIAVAKTRLADVASRITWVQAVYDELPDVLADLKIPKVQAILADLGLSSLQIDRRERGFAYSVAAPLDMRMDQRQELNAASILNQYSETELFRILRDYGEEKFASRIAQAIVKHRSQEIFTNSAQLVEVISQAIPAKARFQGGHPAKRTFQALRIEVNQELVALERMLPAAVAALSVGGRMAVLAYHSLEDRLVKRTFATGSQDKAPADLPFVPSNLTAELKLLTKGAEKPDSEEIAANSRAASARLRAVERIKEAS